MWSIVHSIFMRVTLLSLPFFFEAIFSTYATSLSIKSLNKISLKKITINSCQDLRFIYTKLITAELQPVLKKTLEFLSSS